MKNKPDQITTELQVYYHAQPPLLAELERMLELAPSQAPFHITRWPTRIVLTQLAQRCDQLAPLLGRAPPEFIEEELEGLARLLWAVVGFCFWRQNPEAVREFEDRLERLLAEHDPAESLRALQDGVATLLAFYDREHGAGDD
jgi:hypothetical protein